MNELDSLVEDLIQARDFCGDEQQCIRDWEAENRRLTTAERTAVWRMFETLWNKQQLDAGVRLPIHPDERLRISCLIATPLERTSN